MVLLQKYFFNLILLKAQFHLHQFYEFFNQNKQYLKSVSMEYNQKSELLCLDLIWTFR